jgi:ubiquinone/menaquinone biosynthesis C-methylase UbiE
MNVEQVDATGEPDPVLDDAWYYARFRPGYPPDLIDFLIANCFGPGDRVLDLGCGTGQLTIPLTARGIEVVPLDPSTEMLRELNRELARMGPTRSVQGRAEDLALLVEAPFHGAVFGRSFHLMNRNAVLASCDRMLLPQASVIIITIHWPSGPPAWMVAGHRVSLKYSTPRERHAAPKIEFSEDEVLSDSAFSRLEHWSTEQCVLRNLDEAVGFHFAMPDCSPVVLGRDRPHFEAELRQELLEVCPDAQFSDRQRLKVIWARRPTP